MSTRPDNESIQARVNWICLMIELINMVDRCRQKDGSIVIPANHPAAIGLRGMVAYLKTGRQPETQNRKKVA